MTETEEKQVRKPKMTKATKNVQQKAVTNKIERETVSKVPDTGCGEANETSSDIVLGSESSLQAATKEPLCKQKMHKKILDKGVPDDAQPGIKNAKDTLPPYPLSGMLNKSGGKVRLTFKLEVDQVLIGTKVRGYVRKGMALMALKENAKASSAFQKALEIDPNNQEALDGYRKCISQSSTNPEEIRKQAMSDPEVQQILADPAMRLILEQMQNDPRALQEHLKNPDIAAKIQKLLESGLIAIR